MQNPELTLMTLRSMRVTTRRTTVLSTAMRTAIVSDRLRSTVSRALMAAANRIAPVTPPNEPLPSMGDVSIAVGTRGG